MISSESHSSYILKRSTQNRVLNQQLITSAQRVISRGRDLCQAVHDRRRRSDFFNHLAKYARTFPEMRRYLLIAGSSGDPLQIEIEERTEGVVVRLSGEMDLANMSRFKEAIEPALNNCRNVILDMSNLCYIDSNGLHVIIDAQKVLRKNKCQLVLAGASPGIAKVMHIIQLGRLMHLVPSVDEAISLVRTESSSAASDG